MRQQKTETKTKKASPLKVVQHPDKPVQAEILAQAIVDVADGVRRMNASRLSRDAIVTLIHDKSRIAKRDIEIILVHLDSLEATWLKKVVKQ